MLNGFLPPLLRPGDAIGLFSPAGPLHQKENARQGIELLKRAGFRVKALRWPEDNTGYLAGSDQERCDELHRLLADEEVKALMALRGGFGCLRILELLDWGLFTCHPKYMVGFSDLTALLNGISARTGLITLHGPVLSSLARSDARSRDSFFHTLCRGPKNQSLGKDVEILRSGEARGILRGGNLATLVHLIGTPWEIPWENSILLLEDTGEPPYRLDRMLTQLHQGGKLARLSGLILGDFNLGDDDRLVSQRLQENVWQRILELTGDTSYPIWAGFPAGHRQRNLTLPLGMQTTMDSRRAQLYFEPCA